MALTYAKIRKMRELLIQEMRAETLSVTVDHLLLVEARLANMIAANLDDTSIDGEKANFKPR